ncbi:serine hydrolase [Streptomyces sp. Rer75]|uniref:serine hydrolase domain-containing protein n=1 Tax=Streptomyces sp. Rer75 TaxID=2750011 RepID=UPI0015D0CFE4|nr:serine hydrolase domain-containing protein [Streptomyces sp. Rer75]QLH24324.1 beta-lactamase family protein [Streptomyces sp. Rer75]
MAPYALSRPLRLPRLPRALAVLALAGAVVATAVVPAAAAPRAATPRSPHSATHPATHPATHSATQDALDAITRAGTPGVLARADRADEVWYGASGVGDLRTGRPRLPQDRFRVGSVTKPFTATVLLQLAADPAYGLSIDDTVEKWLPGLVRGNGNDGRRITLRQLLQHTSGLYDFLDDAALRAKYTGTAFFAHRYDGATPKNLVRTALAHEPVFAPNGGWDYSNTNYILAGMVIERATGHAYATEVERRIIKPLGLRGTALPGTSPWLPGPHPRHYSTLFVAGPDARVHDATEFNPSVSGSAGEIISTARDLNVFFRALLRGALLPPAQQKEMFTGRDLGDGKAYGLGIRSQKLTPCGVTVWGHSGEILGAVSRTAATADGEHVITLNQNGDWGDDALEQAAIEAEFCG